MNRLVGGRVYVVDTAGLWLTSNSSATGDFLDLDLQSVNLISTNSGHLEITLESNTASNSIVRLLNSLDFSSIFLDFPKGLKIDERMFVRTCNAGTAYLYFA